MDITKLIFAIIYLTEVAQDWFELGRLEYSAKLALQLEPFCL